MNCQTCNRPMRRKTVKAADAPGTVLAVNKTICHGCKYRLQHGRTGPVQPVRSMADVIEDAEWLAETGENLEAAAKRLGYANPDSFTRSLYRAGRGDLCARFVPLYEVA